MDRATLDAYDLNAAAFADDWLEQPTPQDVYTLLARYFTAGLTADIGCGAGRDTHWLAGNGFDAIGYDASAQLLAQARRRYPGQQFEYGVLPDLAGIAAGTFQNVLCETVIMHLDPSEIAAATRRLLDILIPGGTLFLSWRVTEGAGQRDKHQRLYAAFDPGLVLAQCAPHEVLLQSRQINESSGKIVHRVIVRKAAG